MRLVPHEGIELRDGQTVAVAIPAWLRVEPAEAIARYRWVRLHYASSFFDDPVRPLIRFRTRSGRVYTAAMNGPVPGTAAWMGRVPDNTCEVDISPAHQPGPFAFRLDAIEGLSRLGLARMALQRSWPWTYWAFRSKLLQSPQEAWQALRFALEGTAIDDYAGWLAKYGRPFEAAGLDCRQPSPDGPRFVLLMRPGAATPHTVMATVDSLQAQTYPHWRLGLLDHENTPFGRERDEPRLHALQSPAHWRALLHGVTPDDRIAVVGAGDQLEPHALAVLADHLSRRPHQDVVYSDEDCRDQNGASSSPILKPDWSPVLQRQRPYVGRLACLRLGAIGSGTGRLASLLDDEDSAVSQIAADGGAVGHVRRVLYHRMAVTASLASAKPGVRAAAPPPDPAIWPEVGVVIPTRDGAELLATCIRGLRKETDYPSLRVVIVDNGSTARDAVALLSELRKEPGVTVLDRPGPFNFSRLSNDGAAAVNSPVLLFLNNDIEVLDPGWLKPLIRWALCPDIGAVGAKLLFRDGSLQHAGVVVGFGGLAGHLYRRHPADYGGYRDHLDVPHEVAAVTGACVAVEKTKFDAVAGFDEVNLPVDLNDIDFCLRLHERGWTSLWTPEATLIHLQSATRGIDKDPFALYGKERAYFAHRWLAVIRDDPYFHPGLSLFAHAGKLW